MKVGLVLGGGGAKGFAHLGVLKVLKQAGIKIDVVAGTSIGALVGAVFAADTLSTLEEEALEIKLSAIPRLLSPAWSLSGFFSGENALDLLSEIVGTENIEELPIPFAALAVDLNTASRVTFTNGNLRQAVRASFAIPAVFTPVRINEMLLVDGGTLEPLPVETARILGADFVIAVDLFGENVDPCARGSRLPTGLQSALGYLKNITTKLGRPVEDKNLVLPNIIDIMESTLSVMQQELTAFRRSEFPPDQLIQPSVADVGLLDFHQGKTIIERGIAAAEDALPDLLSSLEKAQTDFHAKISAKT